jgi:hypothetical protein
VLSLGFRPKFLKHLTFVQSGLHSSILRQPGKIDYSVGSIKVCYTIGVLLTVFPQIYAVISPSGNEMCIAHSVDVHVHLMRLTAISRASF